MLTASTSAFLVVFARAEGIPAVAIAAIRLTLASFIVFPIAFSRSRNEWRALSRTDWALAILAGILLGFHFAFWISSLDFTSVMSSIVFVSTNPLFVGIASVLVFRESLRRGTVFGIGIAAIGSLIIGMSDAQHAGTDSLLGDFLALMGAVTISGYLMIGRRLRKRLSLIGYIGIIYTTAAVVLLILACAMGANLFGYSPLGYFFILLLVLGPQLLGHSSYNWALKYVSATFVTVALLAEPIGVSLLAMPVLNQIPEPIKFVGGALIMLGIYLAAREETKPTEAEEAIAVTET
jgi:drug/metabolite transporter (DMT)-like permease